MIKVEYDKEDILKPLCDECLDLDLYEDMIRMDYGNIICKACLEKGLELLGEK